MNKYSVCLFDEMNDSTVSARDPALRTESGASLLKHPYSRRMHTDAVMQ